MLSGDPSGALQAVAGPAAQEAARTSLPRVQARSLEALIPRLERFGERGSRWSRVLDEARQRGSSAVGAAHFIMSRSDPEYRAAQEALREEDENGNNQ